MLFVALETSGGQGSVALVRDGIVLAEDAFAGGMEHGRAAAVRLEAVLASAGVAPRDLDAIAAGIGPGSYTGIRIAVTLAKTLAYALRLPVAAESSLRVMAANAAGGGNGSRLVATLLDARQGFLYGALFEVNERGVERLLPDQVAALPDLAAAFARRLDDLGRDRVLACGDGADLFLERLARLDGQKPTFERGPGAWDVPRAGRLASLAWPALQGTSGAPFDPEAVHRLEPAYLRPTDAERKRALAARDA